MKCPNCSKEIKPRIKLTEKQQRRWELYHLGGYTLQQIADIEKISKKSAWKSIKKGNKQGNSVLNNEESI